MKEVTIKAHTRKSKKGKTVSVHSYSRRVGRKGTISPKRSKGEEYEKLSQEVTFEANEPEEEPMTLGPYHIENYKPPQEESKKPEIQVKDAAYSKKRRKDFMSKIEDKIASFISKHSTKTYKRYL